MSLMEQGFVGPERVRVQVALPPAQRLRGRRLKGPLSTQQLLAHCPYFGIYSSLKES